MQLAGRGIPRGEGVGFEIFDKPNFGISDFVQRANYVRALQGELGRTICQMEDIDSARITIVLPENRLLIDKDKHPTASVFVRVRGNSALAPPVVNAIRFLVANSVEGLKANYVAVVDNMGNLLSENSEEDSLAGLSSTQLAARRNLELYLSKKAEGMLEKVLGPGQAIVRVSADINTETVSTISEKIDPDGQVPRSVTKNDETTDTTSANGANEAVGIASNIPNETNASSQASGPLNTSRMKKTTGTTEYEISRVTSNVFQSAGGIRRLSAAVTVAAKFDGAGTARKIVARTPEEIEKLRRVVQSALGSDTTRGDLIVLEEMAFNDQYANQINDRLEKQERTEFWWTLGKTLLYPGVALAILAVFLRLLKRTTSDDIPIGIPLSYYGSNGHGNGNGNGNGNGHGNGNGNGDSDTPEWQRDSRVVTVEVLNRLVRENPSNVTQAIRTPCTLR
eukprot:TRINITY_DN26667_c0_g1_i1.p2 TRINITY_DN26667_c0_g1~~TRINITY_DN26667_c0_g1_i1.p2  ORF type:complete len:452 (-),score=75.57 TRINITY_DN26667_c0_g1_i1:3-1358(-)